MLRYKAGSDQMSESALAFAHTNYDAYKSHDDHMPNTAFPMGTSQEMQTAR